MVREEDTGDKEETDENKSEDEDEEERERPDIPVVIDEIPGNEGDAEEGGAA